MTSTERIAELEQRVADVEQLVAVGAWLHNELVHELRTLIATQLGPQMQRSPAVIARAKKIAALRKTAAL